MATLDIELKRVDRIYRPGEMVVGLVVINSQKPLTHNGITLVMEGGVTLQLSAKSVGLWEAFNNALKPIQLVNLTAEISKPGKFGRTEFPFEFKLEPQSGQETLYETYHGVFVNIQYNLHCECLRGMLAKNMQKHLEFIVESKGTELPADAKTPLPFTVTPDNLQNVKKSSLKNIPKFKITGSLASTVCPISQPFNGNMVVEESKSTIKSIELQLVRVETCGCADGFAKEATEIQNIQVADGDICRGLSIPLFMVFPRLFTCPTVASRTFKVEFEVNLVVMLANGHLITENFPIRLVRA